MRVATWNLWWQFGPWQQRQPLIVDEMNEIDADIVCVQEVWSDDEADQAHLLADALGYRVTRTMTDDGQPQSFGNAILSRFPLETVGQRALPSADGSPSHRSVLAARVDIHGHRQLVVNTHLEWRYSQSALRQRQLATVVDFVAELRHDVAQADERSANPEAVILTGDLNAVPESQEIRRLTGLEPPYREDLIFTDAWAATRDDPGHTWIRDNPNSAEALWPRRRLDYVLVSWPRSKPWANPLSARLAGRGVATKETAPSDHGDRLGAQAPSDHLAVVVELDNRQTLGHG